jgi:acyl-CoA synthetase (AMP-forming)/AMP-acid ligase II
LVLEKSFTYLGPVINDITSQSITVFPGVPTVFSMLISHHRKKPLRLTSVTKVTNTGAALSDALIPDMKRIFPNASIYKMYGLTECKRVSYLEPELLDRKPKSVGKAIPGTEVLLRSPEGNAVKCGDPGILHVRGPHVMLGYWNDAKLSEETLLPGHYPYERILRTGDWFRIDEDGFLYFLGRSDDIINSRGEKVSPTEVENAIRRLPEVEEVKIIGIPDEVLGEAIRAYVVRRPSQTLTESDVKLQCSNMLEDFMVPQEVIIVDMLPLTSSGKVKKPRS